jgi:hypothetical protein
LAAVAGAAFLEGRLLLLGELVGEAITMFEMPLGVRAIEFSPLKILDQISALGLI